MLDTSKLLPNSNSSERQADANATLVKVTKKTVSLTKFFKDRNKKKKNEIRKEQIEDVKEEREEEEKRLEKPSKNEEKKKVKVGSVKKLGILGWFKNFIGTTILGFFAVRLIEHLPKLRGIATALAAAAEFAIDIGGKFLNGLTTFIDIGYKAYDFTIGALDDIGGDKFVNIFNGLIDKISFAIDAIIIATLISGKGGIGQLFKRKPPKTPKPKAPKLPKLPRVGRLIRGVLTGLGAVGVAVLSKGKVKAGKIAGPIKSASRSGVAGNILREKSRKVGTSKAVTGDVRSISETNIKPKVKKLKGSAAAQSLVESSIGSMTGSGKPPVTPTVTPKIKSGLPSRLTGDLDEPTKKPTKKLSPARKTVTNVPLGDELLKRQIIENPKAKKIFETFLIKKLKTRDPFGLYPSTLKLEDLAEVFETTTDKLIDAELSVKGPKGFKKVLQLEKLVTQDLTPPPPPPESTIRKSREFLPPGSGPRITGDVIEPELSPKNPSLLKKVFGRVKGGIGSPIKRFVPFIGPALDIVFGKMNYDARKSEGQTDFQALSGVTGGILGGIIAAATAAVFIPEPTTTLAGLGVLGLLSLAGMGGSMIGESAADKATGVEESKEKGSKEKGLFDNLMSGIGSIFVPAAKATTLDESVPPPPRTSTDGQPYKPEKEDKVDKKVPVDVKNKKPVSPSKGSELAGELGRWLNSKQLRWGSGVTEHPEHGGVNDVHTDDSLHYKEQGYRAIDIGGWGPKRYKQEGQTGVDDQTKILAGIAEWNKMKGVSPIELIHEGNDYAGHNDHVHVAYKKGGLIPRNTRAFLHKDEIVIDKDSSDPARNLLLAINEAKGKEGIMRAISDYAPYDDNSSDTIIINRNNIIAPPPAQSQSGPSVVMVKSGFSDPFEHLDFSG